METTNPTRIVHGVTLTEKKKLFIILDKELARSPTTLKKLGGRSKYPLHRWSFLKKDMERVQEWLSDIATGNKEHDLLEPKMKKQQPVLHTNSGRLSVETEEPEVGDFIVINLSKVFKKRTKRITSIERNEHGVAVYIHYYESNIMIRGFASNKLDFVSGEWQLNGFSLPHTIVFFKRKTLRENDTPDSINSD